MSTTAQSVQHWGPQLGFEYLSDCGLCHTCNFVVRGNRVVSSAAAVVAWQPRQPALKAAARNLLFCLHLEFVAASWKCSSSSWCCSCRAPRKLLNKTDSCKIELDAKLWQVKQAHTHTNTHRVRCVVCVCSQRSGGQLSQVKLSSVGRSCAEFTKLIINKKSNEACQMHLNSSTAKWAIQLPWIKWTELTGNTRGQRSRGLGK